MPAPADLANSVCDGGQLLICLLVYKLPFYVTLTLEDVVSQAPEVKEITFVQRLHLLILCFDNSIFPMLQKIMQ